MQRQVRFNSVPQNIPEKVPGSRGAKPSEVQQVPGKVAEAKPGEVHLTHGKLAEVFPALGFPACLRKIYKNKTLRLLGIPPKPIVFFSVFPRYLTSVGYFKETGINHRQSCQSAFGNAVKHQ